MSELTFITAKWLQPLLKKLVPLEKKLAAGIRDKQIEELGKISDTFGLSSDLVRCYVEPYCQDHRPVDHAENRRAIFPIRVPLFATINTFLRGDPLRFTGGNRRMFLLSEDGMGKTSLFMMIKLAHLTGLWPREYDCLLLKLGNDTLDTVWRHPNKANTILLLDALDEDPLAWGKFQDRTQEILEATGDYHRVLISCRTRPLLDTAVYVADHPGQVRIGSHLCPLIILTPFDHEQVTHYLTKRFPNHPCDIFFHCSDSLREQAQHFVDGIHPAHFPSLLLAHIHDILATKPREFDPYSLYLALFETWLARQEARLRTLPKKKLADTDLKDLRTVLISIAVLLQQKGEHRLSRAARYKLEQDRHLPIRNLRHMDTGAGSLLHRDTAGNLRFVHRTIQEFLVAHGILIGQADLIRDTLRITDQLTAFLKAANATDFQLPKQLGSLQSFMPTPEFHFYDRMTDGSRGPAMQPIPVSEFLMGSPKGKGDKSEYPQHHVRIAAPFALGTWPVTFDEYDRFCTATGRKKAPDQGWGRRRHPAINVSWQDAIDYCAWLSRETGYHYRLPSEAEWEYAARAGTDTEYWWGDDFHDGSGIHRANCDDSDAGSDTRQTSIVGGFPPNPFGLYDTAGNLWEWTADCWHDNYQNAPTDSCVWGEENLGDCTQRVVRGGSWNNAPFELRSASRSRYYASDATYSLLGFRLARDF